MKIIQELSRFKDKDPTAFERKSDHIELAFQSAVDNGLLDKRFNYEPLFSAHPKNESSFEQTFLGKKIEAPFWVSSMTGGTEYAATINRNLAKVAHDFKFGMGLGSCRSLLTDDTYLPDFDVRHYLGDDLPLYANLGIAQLEELIQQKQEYLVIDLLNKLSADGLIIHVNPMQEWLQPEGDRFCQPAIDTIVHYLNKFPDISFIVKEVGQGMGPESLKALLRLPLSAIEFAAHGGTNFAKLEMMRAKHTATDYFAKLANVGHSAHQMVNMVNEIVADNHEKLQCKELIISGGVKDFLDGYYLNNKVALNSVYGQASAFLKYAKDSYEDLYDFVDAQLEGYKVAAAFLRIKETP